MKKLLNITFFLLFGILVFALPPKAVFAEICPGITIKQEPEKTLPTTHSTKIIVSSPQDCFVPGEDYSYTVWFENASIRRGSVKRTIKPQDRKTLVADWDISLPIAHSSPGVWHFSLWFGKEVDDRKPDKIVVQQYNFTIAYPGGNPSISPKQSAYQVGTNSTFVVSNAQTGQDYTFWWDGDQIARQEIKGASGTSFETNPIPPPDNNPGNKKFCMYPGGVNGGSVRFVPCEFSTNATFTIGPPPTTGTPGSPGYVPVAPQNFVATCPGGTQGINTAVGCIPIENANSFAGWFLKWAIGIAGGIAFLMLIFSGFQIMTSSNNPQQLQTGRELLTAAVSGLILIVFSAFLLKLIGVDILGIPGLGSP